MMIGAWLTSRMREQRLKPSMSGRPTSRRIRAGSSSSSARRACRPSAAVRTDMPGLSQRLTHEQADMWLIVDDENER